MPDNVNVICILMDSMNSKERCFKSIKGERVDRVPVFPLLMSFSAARHDITYRQFASSGHALAESQLKVREMFGIDAITACSDAFRVSADLGGDIVFPEDKPPYLIKPLVKNEYDFKHLKKPDVADPATRMADRVLGVNEMVKAAGDRCLVLGWVDMPFAEACSICGVSSVMLMIYDNPELLKQLLNFLTDIVIEFAVAQVNAGAAMIGAGDAAASLISVDSYREFALPFEKRVCESIHNAGAMAKLHICGNTTHMLNDMVLSGADLFNVDHLVDFDLACQVYGNADKCFKGNIDPVADMLQSTPEICQKKAIACIKRARGRKYMLSAGCEIPAATSDEVFRAFCEAPLLVSKEYNNSNK